MSLPDLRALIRVPSSDNGVEFLWGERVGGLDYRLLSVPVFAYGLSRGAIVRIRPHEATGELLFDRIVGDSEGGTVRLYLNEGYTASDIHEQHVLKLAASRGLGIGPATILPPEVIAIHVHSRDDLEQVGLALDELVSSGYGRFWELGDPDLQPSGDSDDVTYSEAWQLVHPPPEPREIFIIER